jgi:hypothetical protein
MIFPKILHMFARLDLGYLVLHLNKMIVKLFFMAVYNGI